MPRFAMKQDLSIARYVPQHNVRHGLLNEKTRDNDRYYYGIPAGTLGRTDETYRDVGQGKAVWRFPENRMGFVIMQHYEQIILYRPQEGQSKYPKANFFDSLLYTKIRDWENVQGRID